MTNRKEDDELLKNGEKLQSSPHDESWIRCNAPFMTTSKMEYQI